MRPVAGHCDAHAHQDHERPQRRERPRRRAQPQPCPHPQRLRRRAWAPAATEAAAQARDAAFGAPPHLGAVSGTPSRHPAVVRALCRERVRMRQRVNRRAWVPSARLVVQIREGSSGRLARTAWRSLAATPGFSRAARRGAAPARVFRSGARSQGRAAQARVGWARARRKAGRGAPVAPWRIPGFPAPGSSSPYPLRRPRDARGRAAASPAG